jgi:hypothetical protein
LPTLSLTSAGSEATRGCSTASPSTPVRVSQHCAPEDALWGLLHDASEAYLCDVPAPLKELPQFDAYRAAERSLQHAMAMLIPEAWAKNEHMNPQKRAFYEYHASLMEPWDGPAAIVIIGGGDTGADCLGTTHRQGARSVTQFELLPQPPDTRSPLTPWPLWPMQLRVESSHEEGGTRDWSVHTVKFTGDEHGNVRQLHAVRVTPKVEPLPGTEFTLEADLVLLAMGFTGPVKNGMIEQLGVELEPRGNVAVDANYMSSVGGVFAAGDMRRGQSLVVWAIAEGRQAAEGIDRYLRA